MEFSKDLPKAISIICEKFIKKDFNIYLVGGIVRHLFQKENLAHIKGLSDWDLTTNATPEQILKLFPHAFYNNNFGTVGIPVKIDKQETVVEVTTFRSESEYKDFRRPGKIVWGKSIEEDLARRDFTINAIATQLVLTKGKVSTANIKIIDLYGGQEDLKKKRLKAVGVAEERFSEDALRMLRAIRLSTRLNFTIEENTWKALLKNVHLIEKISKERIRDELLKILSSEKAYEGILLFDECGMLDIIFPELTRGKGVSQIRPGRHHKSDVFTHNILSLEHCPSKDPIVKLATLLHDVGKPYVLSKDSQGHVIFYNHEVKGAYVAKEIADRLRLSKKQKEKIFTLIRWHMFSVDERITDSAIRRFIRRVGVENVSDMIDLRIGDRLGGGTQVAESWRLKKFKERLSEQLNPPFSINDLAINGNDVMRELNLQPGPKVGEILQKLFQEADEDLEKNKKAYLLKKLRELK